MNLSKNKQLKPEELDDYKYAQQVMILFGVIGTVIILAFSNVPIIISALSLVLLTGGYFTFKQIQYKQYKDLKISLSFLVLAVVMALALWLSYLFM